MTKPKPLTAGQMMLADYATQMAHAPEEMRAQFDEMVKMPLKDRVCLLEFQLMHATMMLSATMEALTEMRNEPNLTPMNRSSLILPN